MKYIPCFFFCLLLSIVNLYGQDLLEAQKYEKAKKYEDAASLYFDLYRFEEAAACYELRIDQLKKLRKPDEVEIARLESLLEKTQRAARMLSRCEDVQIVDSIVVSKKAFLNAYFMGEGSGTLKMSDSMTVYENQLGDRRYSARKDTTGLLQIYSRTKIGEDWAEERFLNIPSDAPGDNNYPFLMSDGLTIYFASTGNGSIGGYDLFVTRYNLNSDTYLVPSQLGMPFNSIYNDFMLAIDEENEIGYFATDRFQPVGKVVIYAFVPTEAYIPLDDLDGEELIARAKLSSIRNTWKSGLSYAGYLDRVKADIEKENQKLRREFVFPINDKIVYYVLSDFENEPAKRFFLTAQTLRKQISDLEQKLEEQRFQYKSASGSVRASLRNPILQNEKKLEESVARLKEAEKSARNQEIKHLRQNTK